MFPQHYAVLVVGGPGAGLFEFCGYLASFYLDRGDGVVFVETNTPPETVRRQIRGFGIEPLDLEGDRLIFVDCSSAAAQKPRPDPRALTLERLSNLDDLLRRINEGIEWVGTPLYVIFDSLTALHLHSHDTDVARFYQELSTGVRAHGALTCTLQEGVHDDRQVNLLSSIADGLMEMRMDSTLQRLVRIRHMRGMSVTPNWVPFDLAPVREERAGAFLGWSRRREE